MFSFISRAHLGRKLAVAAVIPALVLSTAGVAVAATNTLTLTVLNRSGAKVSVAATVVNVDTNMTYSIRSGKAKKLPKGSYVVLASITTGNTSTLGGKAVKVAGFAKLTIDARKGKLVRLGLSPAPAGLAGNLSVRVCDRSESSYHVEAYGDAVYVIPTASKKVAFAALGSWGDSTGTSDAYAVVHQTTGVPANPSRTFGRSSLGTVSVVSRRGPNGSDRADVAVQPINRGCADQMYANMWNAYQPTSTNLRLSTGAWNVRSDTAASTKDGQNWDIGGYFAYRTIAAGKSYRVQLHSAAWGPSTQLPVTLFGRISFGLNDMFADPYFMRNGSVEGGDKATATLTFKGKTVKTKKDRGWEPESTELYYTVKKAGWYTLTNTGTRYYPEITYPAGMLSTASVVSYRFYTKPKSNALAEVNSLTMVPTGLNMRNRAKAGSTTNVFLKLNRFSQDPDAKRGKNPKLKTLTAKMSPDGGRTWRAVRVAKIGGTWTAIVPNPASGAVTLRARATYTTGGYTDVTIYRAYAIA